MSTRLPTLPSAPLGGAHDSGRRPPSRRRGLYPFGLVALIAGIIGASGPAAIMLASGALETKTVTVTAPVATYLGVGAVDTPVSGALIRSISANGPAARAGLHAGDRIVSIDGSRISGVSELVAVLALHAAGERVPVTVRRGSATRTLDVTLARRPETAART